MQYSVLAHWRYNATLLQQDPDVVNTIKNVPYPDGREPMADDVGGWHGVADDAGTALRLTLHIDDGRRLTGDQDIDEWLEAFVEEVMEWGYPEFTVRGVCCVLCVLCAVLCCMCAVCCVLCAVCCVLCAV